MCVAESNYLEQSFATKSKMAGLHFHEEMGEPTAKEHSSVLTQKWIQFPGHLNQNMHEERLGLPEL